MNVSRGIWIKRRCRISGSGAGVGGRSEIQYLTNSDVTLVLLAQEARSD